MDPEMVPVPNPQPNVLRGFLTTAADRADVAVDTLGNRGTNPLDAAVSRLSTAWVADGSWAREAYSESLLGVGTAIRSAFVAGANQLRTAEGLEKTPIDVTEHPELEWKTSKTRIEARAWAFSHGYR